MQSCCMILFITEEEDVSELCAMFHVVRERRVGETDDMERFGGEGMEEKMYGVFSSVAKELGASLDYGLAVCHEGAFDGLGEG